MYRNLTKSDSTVKAEKGLLRLRAQERPSWKSVALKGVFKEKLYKKTVSESKVWR